MLIWRVKLAKNADPDKYVNTSYAIGFTLLSEFSLPVGSVVKNVIILGADLSSSVHIDNKIKDILIFHEGSTQKSDDTTLTPEAQ